MREPTMSDDRDRRARELTARHRAAQELAPTLPGLSVKQARRRITGAGLEAIELTPEGGSDQVIHFGCVTIVVVRGKVIDAAAG